MGGGHQHHDDMGNGGDMGGDHHHHDDMMGGGGNGHHYHDDMNGGGHMGDGHMADRAGGGLLGGLLGGATSGGSSGAVYVQVTVHNNFDCSAEVVLQSTFGANICMAVQTSNGASSTQFSLSSLVLAVEQFADTACKAVMEVIPISELGSLLNRCVAGVKVAVSSSPPAAPSGAGELVSEYVSSQGCSNNQPIQQLWVSTNHLSDLLGGVVPIDDALSTLISFLGNPTSCVNVNLNEASIVGVTYNASVYYSVSSTV